MKKLAKSTADSEATQAAIQDLLQAYETALNASNTDAVLSLFAPDGVFMAQHFPAMVGTDAVRAAYDGIFQTITFDTELQVEEIVQVAPNWAFGRTTSNGSVNVHAIGQKVPDANHELFVFQKVDDGAWKIARYCFSTTNPPRQ